ncbi:glycine cleavage system aminomethyltransferase GcvT [Kineococcus rhizosphaerae]|uniref:Aminomethyltransferase n=1 Tax=Kineococcus rhizosphaerae TaxID=559628 RepID=A0A2T0R5Z7_9ACTN|nr:glycine cleavage system aminomethyltransferase GcvT [Kineococcus rhizosphaerae]PRY16594.1 aminomethyltransferase [Kineococcus rhizosphaerae]
MSSTPSPLAAAHAALGASMTDFAGWSMPLRYASDLAEHQAVRTTAGIFDLSHMGEVRVSGPEAARALDHALVGTPSTMPLGRAAYGMVVDADGGILDDLVTYRLGEQEFLVVANAANAAVVVAALTERCAGFDAVVADETAGWALVAVQGPASLAVVGPLVDADLGALGYYRCLPAVLAGASGDVEVLLARTGYTGEDGFEVFVPVAHALAVWDALLAATREHGGVPAGLACRDTLRLEAGMPLYGHELSRDVTPFAAGLGRVVKLDKEPGGVGYDALRRLAGTEPARVLVGLRGAGRRAPRAGYAVVHDGSAVGEVTSGALSPTLGFPVAMAYVQRELSAPGTALHVDVRGTALPVEVVALPFYRRER